MLTAKVCVCYEGDWTAELAQYNTSAEFLASTFRDRRYLGIVVLETDDYDAALEVIDDHQTIDSIEIIERHESSQRGRTTATISLRGQLTEFTPLQTLLYEGFLPLGPTRLENGRECFDLLVDDREELSKAIELLDGFGNVALERISEEFRHEVVPSTAEWQELIATIPPRQRELLNRAAQQGYFEIPRQVTLEELADKMGITKTTASNHLRKAEHQMIEFLLPYINLAATDE
jgi:predicted DNA binding protein